MPVQTDITLNAFKQRLVVALAKQAECTEEINGLRNIIQGFNLATTLAETEEQVDNGNDPANS